jgi:hypothetical protein
LSGNLQNQRNDEFLPNKKYLDFKLSLLSGTKERENFLYTTTMHLLQGMSGQVAIDNSMKLIRGALLSGEVSKS